MSRSLRYKAVPSQSKGFFAVIDSANNSLVHDGFRDYRDAKNRARGLNEAVTPAKPKGYISVCCPGCNAALLVRPGDELNCPQCARERDQIEAQIAWEETRQAELEQARLELEESFFIRSRTPLTLACVD